MATLDLDNILFFEPYLNFNSMLAAMVKSFVLFMEAGLYQPNLFLVCFQVEQEMSSYHYCDVSSCLVWWYGKS
jgi:hypothetical protein